MAHVVEATYEDGVLKPAQPLPLKDRERVRVSVERIAAGGHSVLDIPPVSLGQMRSVHAEDTDLLAEMLEGRS